MLGMVFANYARAIAHLAALLVVKGAQVVQTHAHVATKWHMIAVERILALEALQLALKMDHELLHALVRHVPRQSRNCVEVAKSSPPPAGQAQRPGRLRESLERAPPFLHTTATAWRCAEASSACASVAVPSMQRL